MISQRLIEKFNYKNSFYTPKRLIVIYILFLYVITAYHFITWPIIAGDTDLWYHLNSGRYFFENKAIPRNSFFSFVSPAREWTDYFWLFQALVYKIYSFFGYYGLIVFKAAVYLATVSVISCYLLKNVDLNEITPSLYHLIIILFYFLVLVPRYLLVRPHTLTYFFIVIFLYILEFKPKKTIFLPLLAILWANLHGIEYPVMILITLSYTIEFFVKRIKDRITLTKNEFLYIISLVLSMWSIFLTPHGSKLIKIPFISTEYASLYINELRNLKLEDLLSIHITTISPGYLTFFNILLIMACLAIINSFIRKQIRISHLLMFAGGVILLTKGVRFINESILLSIPVLKANTLISSDSTNKKVFRPVSISLVLVLIMPLMFLKNIFPNQPKYPFSGRGLPQGVVIFLKHIDVGGDVLNYPNSGGYLQWELYPRYKIFMDMEVPFLFTDEDFYIAINTYSSEETLRKMISKYNPSFIVVPSEKIAFKEIIKSFSNYITVFFDDSEILYVNKSKHPEIAEKYELKEIDPFTIVGKDIGQFKGERRDLILKELLRLSEIYPDSNIINQIIVIIYNMEGNYEKSLPYVDLIIKNTPELPKGYRLRGDSLMGLKRFDEAILSYKQALKRSEEGEKSEIYRKLWICYSNLKQYKKAYKALKKSINIFSPTTTFRDLYDFGLTALQAGKTTEALMLFKFSLLKVPSNNNEWKQKIQEQLSKFIVGDEKDKKFYILE